MYKVLIVDDEKYVISLIERLVDWEKLGMEVIGRQDRTARHGLQLLKDAPAGFPAAVVHHHNLLRPLFQKSRRESRKYLIRIQRRNDDHTAA